MGVSGFFIPGAAGSVAQVDAVGEHGEGGGFEDELFAVAFDIFWPAVGATFEPFGDAPVAGAVEVEDFDEGAAAVGEEEGGPGERVEFEPGTGYFGEAVEGFAHVAGLEGDVIDGGARAAGQCDAEDETALDSRSGSDFGEEEFWALAFRRCGIAAPLRGSDPANEGGVFDPAVLGEGRATHPARGVGGEDSFAVLAAVAWTPGGVTLDDGSGGFFIRRCHSTEGYGIYAMLR